MEKKYIKSTDVSKILVSDRKEIQVEYHEKKPEKKNFWGAITQRFSPEGYFIRGWGVINDFNTKYPEKYAEEYGKRTDSKMVYIDGKFFILSSMRIIYKGDGKYPDVYYFQTYNEAIQASERLAGLCNLIPII